MATVNKNFKIKNGLVVEGTTATVNGNQILTETASDSYILNLIGGETLVKSVEATQLEVSGAGKLSVKANVFDASGSAAAAQSAAASDATTKANAAQSAAAADATTKANAAQAAAAADATTKAATAKSEAISSASADATSKANAALSSAEDYTDSAISTEVTGRNTAITTAITNLNLANTYDAKGAAAQALVDSKAYTDQEVSDLVGSAPALLDTLNELATAISNNPNYATDAANAVAGRVAKSGDTMTGALTLSGTPTVDLHAATKGYVDSAASTAQGNAEDYADGLAGGVAGDLSDHEAATEAHGATGAVVGTTNTQTLTNKTIGDTLNFTGAGAMTINSDSHIVLTPAAGSSVKWGSDVLATQAYVDNQTTSDVAEGTSQYFTDARAKDSAADLLTGANLTNITITGTGSGLTITAENGIADSTTSNLVEGSNLYFTDARAIAATAASYDVLGAAAAAQSAAASDATTKANDARSAAEATASSDATSKANAAQAAAISAAATDASTKAATAKSEAISAAATDATTKANNAKSAAEATASADATSKANAAQSAAEATAATDATNKVAAEAALRISGDAASVSTAAADATSKANAAVTSANGYTDTAISTEVSNRNSAISSAISTEVSNRNTAITNAVAAVVDSAPAALDTLNELAAALANSPDTVSNLTTLVGTKAPLASPALTGVPTAPTAAADTSTTQIATTAFAKAEADAAQAAAEATASADATSKANAAKTAAEATASADATSKANAAQSAAISAAATDATTKANAAQSAAEATAAADATSKANAARTAAEAYADALDTDDVAEGSNLYFTDARARSAVDGTSRSFTSVELNSVAKQVAATLSAPTAGVQTAYSWAKADFRSAEFLVRVGSGSNTEISKVLLTLDTADNIAITEYGIVATNSALSTVTAAISGSNVELRVTTLNNTSVVTVMGTLIK
jgi:hypothetical protein